MPIDGAAIVSLGDELYEALVENRTIPNLRDRTPGMDVIDAYRVQERMIARRLSAGERIVGKKIGVTSKVVQEAIGVFEPDFGQLTDAMLVANGAIVDMRTLIQPKAEGEIAFVLKRDLVGPGITADDVLAATDYVTACFEIVDSRIKDWDIRIQDTVADNASCGIFSLGDARVDPASVDLPSVSMTIERNGVPVSSGTGAAVQGSPLNSVAWLANTLGRLGMPFKAGEVILSGALGPMVTVAAGETFELSFDNGLGTCTLVFE